MISFGWRLDKPSHTWAAVALSVFVTYDLTFETKEHRRKCKEALPRLRRFHVEGHGNNTNNNKKRSRRRRIEEGSWCRGTPMLGTPHKSMGTVMCSCMGRRNLLFIPCCPPEFQEEYVSFSFIKKIKEELV